MTAANGHALQRRDVVNTRPASGRNGIHLDEQQQRAYAYTIDGGAWLEVITGVPGAGKSRLINISEVATAYQDARLQRVLRLIIDEVSTLGPPSVSI